MIKLTNMALGHEGNALLINPSHVLAIFETSREVPNKKKTVETITNIYSITQQNWEVKESLEKVYGLIKDSEI